MEGTLKNEVEKAEFTLSLFKVVWSIRAFARP